MPVSRLAHIPGIGVDEIGEPRPPPGTMLLRLENLDTESAAPGRPEDHPGRDRRR